MKRFRLDDEALYCGFPESKVECLNTERKRAIILEVLPENDLYDYRIFIDVVGKIKKVKESQLFPVPTPTY
mgnify:CR=1 FL=1